MAGQETCAGENLLNESIEWCNKLYIRCVAMGINPLPAKARPDNFKLNKALWAENDKETRADLNKLKKSKINTNANNKKLYARHDTSRRQALVQIQMLNNG